MTVVLVLFNISLSIYISLKLNEKDLLINKLDKENVNLKKQIKRLWKELKKDAKQNRH